MSEPKPSRSLRLRQERDELRRRVAELQEKAKVRPQYATDRVDCPLCGGGNAMDKGTTTRAIAEHVLMALRSLGEK
jgi:hypothetical protein